MQIRDGIIEAIGHTPLIKLERASEATGCTILGKAEFMNPGGSVKDRAGRQMILEAEKRGELRPGGLVVEATAGNTGIGLALVANARGYRTYQGKTACREPPSRSRGEWPCWCPRWCCIRHSSRSRGCKHLVRRWCGLHPNCSQWLSC